LSLQHREELILGDQRRARALSSDRRILVNQAAAPVHCPKAVRVAEPQIQLLHKPALGQLNTHTVLDGMVVPTRLAKVRSRRGKHVWKFPLTSIKGLSPTVTGIEGRVPRVFP